MKRKNKGHVKRFPKVKKDIRDFLVSEEGKITKKKVAKMGVSLAILGMMLSPGVARAAHTNLYYDAGNTGHTSHSSHASHGSHGSHASHGSHGSHGNHGSGGWC